MTCTILIDRPYAPDAPYPGVDRYDDPEFVPDCRIPYATGVEDDDAILIASRLLFRAEGDVADDPGIRPMRPARYDGVAVLIVAEA